MKRLLVLTSCVALVLVLNNISIAQEAAEVQSPALTVESVVAVEAEAPAAPQALPFGYPPYPTVGAHPAYGVPYSYPRAQRRFGGRLLPRAQQYQPYPLPTPGAVPGAVPPVANPAPPTYHGPVPPLQGTLGVPAAPAAPAAPTVFHRPTPIKNFMSLMTAPRPYIGYNPYGGSMQLAPVPVYQPQ